MLRVIVKVFRYVEKCSHCRKTVETIIYRDISSISILVLEGGREVKCGPPHHVDTMVTALTYIE